MSDRDIVDEITDEDLEAGAAMLRAQRLTPFSELAARIAHDPALTLTIQRGDPPADPSPGDQAA